MYSQCLNRAIVTVMMTSMVIMPLLSHMNAFYLPGVAPKQFASGDTIHLKVKELDSVVTQLPIEYYSLGFCQPDKIKHFAENLGEELTGERIEVNEEIVIIVASIVSTHVFCVCV